MKISEMIANLEEFKDKYGDLDCWYATDDEGNEYHEVYYDPSFRYVDEDGSMYSDEEELEECDVYKEDLTPVCLIN